MSILLNSNIITKVTKNVQNAIEPYLNEAIDLNSTSKQNQKALKAYKDALNKIYLSIGAKDDDTIILNSGCVESTSQIFLSIYLQYILTGRKNSFIISQRATADELRVAKFLETQGCRVYKIPTTVDGTIDIDLLKEYVNNKTALVSVPLVDDESGVIQPLEEISNICQLHGVALYCNAKWAIGRIGVNVERLPVSFLSFEGSVIGAPKDIGALYISQNSPIELSPTVYGNYNEQMGLRASMQSVGNVIGFSKALEDTIDALDFEIEDVRELRDELEQELLKIDGVTALAPWALRVPNVSIFAIEGVHASMLLNALAQKDIIAYSFATLSNGNFDRVSLVDIANLDSSLKHTIVGFSLNNDTSEDDIKTTIKATKEAIETLRAISTNCKEQK